MAVIVLAIGSRGDVEPLAVLVAELSRRGVDALLLAPDDLTHIADQLGAPVRGIGVRTAQVLEDTRSWTGRRLRRNVSGQAVLLRRWVNQIAEPVAHALLHAASPGDTVISGILGREAMLALALGRDIRPVTALLTGQLPTVHRESHFNERYFTGWSRYDRLGSQLGWRIASALGRRAAHAVTRELGQPAFRKPPGILADGERCLVAASPLLVPPAPDWPGGVYQSGHLVAPDRGTLPDAAVAFLEAGDRPVYVGFGTMGESLDHRDRLAMITQAARLSGVRVLTPGPPDWSSTSGGAARAQVLPVGAMPHGVLFPRLAGIVHHGGAGTSFAALRSGVPSVAVPFGVDQHGHARRIAALSVGPPGCRAVRMSATRLAVVLTELVSGRFAARAAEVGEQARAEDGVARAVAWLAAQGLLA